MLCSLSQWARRVTAMPRYHQAVAWCAWQLWHAPAAAKLHNAALPSVPASRCAKAPLGAGHRFAPCRVKATGFMQNCLRWVRSHSRRRFPVVSRPTRRRLRALVAVVSPWHQSGAARCVAGQWPAAIHVVCAPAHPCASPLRGISSARLSARPPPVGAPSDRAPWLLVFAICLVAGHARTTGATGRNHVSQRDRWLTFQVAPSFWQLWSCQLR
jgi:hypothetical protein